MNLIPLYKKRTNDLKNDWSHKWERMITVCSFIQVQFPYTSGENWLRATKEKSTHGHENLKIQSTNLGELCVSKYTLSSWNVLNVIWVQLYPQWTPTQSCWLDLLCVRDDRSISVKSSLGWHKGVTTLTDDPGKALSCILCRAKE